MLERFVAKNLQCGRLYKCLLGDSSHGKQICRLTAYRETKKDTEWCFSVQCTCEKHNFILQHNIHSDISLIYITKQDYVSESYITKIASLLIDCNLFMLPLCLSISLMSLIQRSVYNHNQCALMLIQVIHY